MKRADLVRHLHRHGCRLLREGGRHTIYWTPSNGRVSAVPRHNEVGDILAKKICKDLEIPPP